MAAEKNHTDIALLLIESGCSVDIKDNVSENIGCTLPKKATYGSSSFVYISIV